MKPLRERFSKYTGILRAWKGTYIIYNFLNRKKLRPNKALYKKYGFKKSIFLPVGKKDFKLAHPDIPWLDQPDALEALQNSPDFAQFSETLQAALHQFVKQGYLILNNFFDEEEVDALNKEIDELISSNKVQFNYSGRKIIAAHRYSEIANKVFFKSPKLLELLEFILGTKVIPFQTINFIEGSEQRAHSDAIHMTTEPESYLIAAWIALEDIQEGTGELFYYPGSHRLAFISSEDYDSGNSRWMIGAENNKRYEDKIEALVEEKELQKEVFLAKKGDILIWHANLIHGGSPITKTGTSRRSMVAHYFGDGVICYHEMTQRPAILPDYSKRY